MSPSAALRPCTYPGCTNLVRRGRCEIHPSPRFRSAEVQRLYDRQWQKRRIEHLSSEPWCMECLRAHTFTPATEVHHVRPHHGDVDVFLTSPLVSLCKVCHSRITAQGVQG